MSKFRMLGLGFKQCSHLCRNLQLNAPPALGSGLDGLFQNCRPSSGGQLAQVLLAFLFQALALGFQPSGFGFLAKTLFLYHGLGGLALGLVVLLHVAAGLKHWRLKDGIMTRISLP